MVGEELLRYNKDQKYLCFDLETEGLNLFYHRPFQISYSLFTNNETIKEVNQYIWWKDLKVSKEAAAITNFDYYLYKENAQDPKEIFDSFNEYLQDESIIIVGQNILSYDIMINNVWRRNMGLKEDYSYQKRVLDTSAIFKSFKKSFNLDKNDMLSSQMKILGYREKGLKSNLKLLGEHFQIKFNESELHDALSDVRLNVEVFRKMLWTIEL